jgi:hypothetical protein
MPGAATLTFVGGSLAAVTAESGAQIQRAMDASDNPPTVLADVYGSAGDKVTVKVAQVVMITANPNSTAPPDTTQPLSWGEQLLADMDALIAQYASPTPTAVST